MLAGNKYISILLLYYIFFNYFYFINVIIFKTNKIQTNCDQGPESDKNAFSNFLIELKQAFKPHGYLLSAAVSPSKVVIDSGK